MIHPPTPIWSVRRTDDSSRSQAGRGSSSHRARDANTAWTSASDGTLEEHRYHCQNQHADVVALVTDAGAQREMARDSACGVPFGLPVGDTNSDGDCDQADQNQVRDWALATPAVYDVRGDLDLDGDVDLTDRDTLRDNYKGVTLGRGVLSAAAVRNQRGVAGYVAAGYEPSTYLIRNRVFPSELGVWASRDPLGYVDGTNATNYDISNPVARRDPLGLMSLTPGEGTANPGASAAHAVSDWWCCLRAKLLGLDEGNWGGVICCEGRKVPCNWRTGEGGGPNGNPTLKWTDKNLFDKCIREHESVHAADCDCGLSPPAAVKRCLIPREKHRESELRGHGAEIKCNLNVDCSASPDPALCEEVKADHLLDTIKELARYL